MARARDINTMSEAEYKVFENRLRRMADRQGFRLVKSRRRDPRAYDYNTYRLVDPATNTVAVGGDRGISLDEIERALLEG